MFKKDKWKIDIKEKYIIGEDAAYAQVMSFLEDKNIDVDIYENRERKQFEMILEKVSQSIRLGLISIQRKDGEINVVQHIGGVDGNRDNDLEYTKYTGAIAEQADGLDEKQNNARVHAVAGALTGVGIDAIRLLSEEDLSATQCIVNLFLSV